MLKNYYLHTLLKLRLFCPKFVRRRSRLKIAVILRIIIIYCWYTEDDNRGGFLKLLD